MKKPSPLLFHGEGFFIVAAFPGGRFRGYD